MLVLLTYLFYFSQLYITYEEDKQTNVGNRRQSVTSVVNAKSVPNFLPTSVFHASPRMALGKRRWPTPTNCCPTLQRAVGDAAMSSSASRLQLGVGRTPDVASSVTGDCLARLELQSELFVGLDVGFHRD